MKTLKFIKEGKKCLNVARGIMPFANDKLSKSDLEKIKGGEHIPTGYECKVYYICDAPKAGKVNSCQEYVVFCARYMSCGTLTWEPQSLS